MKIIDMHTHVGSWQPENKYFDVDSLLHSFQKVDVEYFCVSNLDVIDSKYGTDVPIEDEINGNEKLFKLFEDEPRARFLLVCEPRYGNSSNIEFLIEKYKNKISGLKFHPECHKTPANSMLYHPYMELARKYKLPCLFHSGHVKSPYSSPKLIYELAKSYPDVSVILGHLSTGGLSSHKVALKALNASIKTNNSKLFADISWVDIPSIIYAIKSLSPCYDRLMFASDAPLGIYSNQDNYMAFIQAIKEAVELEFENKEEILNKLFFQNAKNLFKIE